MLTLPSSAKLYLATERANLRKSSGGLSTQVESTFGVSAMTGDRCVCFDRRSTQVRILCWERDGFCVLIKQPSQHTVALLRSGRSRFSGLGDHDAWNVHLALQPLYVFAGDASHSSLLLKAVTAKKRISRTCTSIISGIIMRASHKPSSAGHPLHLERGRETKIIKASPTSARHEVARSAQDCGAHPG